MRTILTMLLLALALPASAQLSEGDTLRWGYRLTDNFNWVRGNVERFINVGIAELSHVHRAWGFKLNQEYRYGTFGRAVTENDLLSRNFIYLNPRARAYAYLMAWAEFNYRRSIRWRYLVGPGLTYVPLRNATSVIKASVTVLHEQTDNKRDSYNYSEYAGSTSIATWRAVSRLYARHQLGSKLMLQAELWYMPGLSDTRNQRYSIDAAASYKLGSGFSIRTAYNLTQENVVNTGVEPQDWLWTLGLSWGNH